jgi:hypothetical protein
MQSLGALHCDTRAIRRGRPLTQITRNALQNEAVAKAVRATLPQPVRVRVGSAIGVDKPQEIDLSRLELIRRRDRDWLADPENLERDLLPALGFSADVPDAFPANLHDAVGVGLKHWQYPNQFARYLAHLARYPIRSYLELGVRHGGTFVITVEYLSRFHPIESATAVDIDDVPALHAYLAEHPGVRFMKVDTSTPRFAQRISDGGPYDLVLIDADHSYEACRNDVTLMRDHANILALHDIVDAACPGVREVWRELRAETARERDFFEFTAQYDEIVERNGSPALGLGIAVRKGFGRS